MFKEASVYTLKRHSSEERAAYGLRVLTMRSWPRGIARSDVDFWIPSASPIQELLDGYRAGRVSWHDFIIIYRACQIMARACRVVTYQGQVIPMVEEYPHRALDHLRELEREHGTVTLLCWEKATDPTPEQPVRCHRFLLKELLENPAIEAEMQASLSHGSGQADLSGEEHTR